VATPPHTGKIAHARQLAELIATRYPDRRVHVVGDAAYVGERLRDVDGRITWTDRALIATLTRLLPVRRCLGLLITPATILRWHRQLVTGRWTSAARQPGRPAVPA
jgi:hypothetical protein